MIFYLIPHKTGSNIVQSPELASENRQRGGFLIE